MKHLTLAFALLVTATLTGCGGSSPEEPAIRACFANYKKAIMAKNGQNAGAEIDTNTVEYYSRMRKHVLEASASQTKALGLMDRLIVLMARHRIPAAQVKEMDGKAFFIYAVDQGWVGEVAQIELGRVNVTGTNAKGMHMMGNQKTEIDWQFNKENGKWLIDLTSNLPELEKIFKQSLAQQGLGENEFLFDVLEQLSGEPVTETIWEPAGNPN